MCTVFICYKRVELVDRKDVARATYHISLIVASLINYKSDVIKENEINDDMWIKRKIEKLCDKMQII